jgi:hypothetical protein
MLRTFSRLTKCLEFTVPLVVHLPLAQVLEQFHPVHPLHFPHRSQKPLAACKYLSEKRKKRSNKEQFKKKKKESKEKHRLTPSARDKAAVFAAVDRTASTRWASVKSPPLQPSYSWVSTELTCDERRIGMQIRYIHWVLVYEGGGGMEMGSPPLDFCPPTPR